MKKAGLVAPEFEETENAFRVTIKHKRLATLEDTVLAYLNDNPDAEITNRLVRQLSGENDVNRVKKALQRLRAEGKLKVKDENASAFGYVYVKGDL